MDTHVDYHRNGISGEGFFVVHFDDPNNGRMMAVCFSPDSSDGQFQEFIPKRVLGTVLQDFTILASQYSKRKSWRGDNYQELVYDAIEQYENKEKA